MKEFAIERNEHEGFITLKALITRRGPAFLADLSGAERLEEKETLIKRLKTI